MTTRLLGAPVAEAVHHQNLRTIEQGIAQGWRIPTLVSVHRGSGTPFRFYVRQQAKAAEKVGVRFREEVIPSAWNAADLSARLAQLDRDPEVDGVLLEHPLPSELDFFGAVERLSVGKDTDGVSSRSLGRLVQGHAWPAPAVARAVFAILEHYRIPVTGRNIAVVGRSATVGLPMALLALARRADADATVTVAHLRTPDLRRAIADAQVILTAAGKPGLLGRSITPRGSVVVDVGLSSVPDPEHAGKSRAVGDALADELEGWVEAISPVPGGVGPVTVAMLMDNVVNAWALRHGGSKQ